MLSRRSRKAGIVIETIIILIGLVLVVKAAMLGTSTYRFIHMAQTIDGVVTGVSNYGFTVNVQIAPNPDQSVIFVQNGLLFGYQIGEHVRAFYDPNNPGRAMMQNFGALWFDTFIRALGGFILLAFGFHLRANRSL